MIFILAQTGSEKAGAAVSSALTQQYPMLSAPQQIAPGAVWSGTADWNDLLIVTFVSGALPSEAVKFIGDYSAAHPIGASILPISTDPASLKPPDPVSGIKAVPYDGTPASMANVVKAAAVFLGLGLIAKRQNIFVSYRQTDGKALANEIHDRLKSEGFPAWLDEADENLAGGDQVQTQILQNLQRAALVLLVDTPQARESPWVQFEVDAAIGELIPVLPVVAGGENLSHFSQLMSLRRRALVKVNGMNTAPLTDAEWAGVRSEIDGLLLSCFERRQLLLTRTQSAFVAHGYKWNEVDAAERIYRADRQSAMLPSTKVLSHCSIHDISYEPAVRAACKLFATYQAANSVNQKLYVYADDNVLTAADIARMANNIQGLDAILAHYNELKLLLDSNFQQLRPE